MRTLGELPTSLAVGDREYNIITDYRACLTVIQAMNDPEMESAEKVEVAMLLFEDIETIPSEDYQAAYDAVLNFLDHRAGDKKRPSPRVLDWEQDEDILFPAINRAAGFEVREAPYMHWWSFLGYLMAVDSDSVLSHVLSLRNKKAKGKRLEKWEAEYWNANRAMCELRGPETPEQKKRKEALRELFR